MTHTSTEQERALADLRHMYAQMIGGMVKDSAQAKRIADGILSRAIQKLEQAARRAPAVPVPQVTDEMIEAAEEAYMPFGDMGLAIQCALAAAPQPPEAAPVQLPEYGIDTANHAGIRVRGYTKDQVLAILAQHGIKTT